MTPARPLCLLATLLSLAGCSDPEPGTEERCTGSVSGAVTQPQSPLLVVGKPGTVKVFADRVPNCLEPDTVTAEVYGPGNIRVPSEIELNPANVLWTANLRFTPPVPGAYHVIVSFAPVGGLQQLMLLAGTDQTATPAVAELDRLQCSHVDRTSRGTWLCNGAARLPGAQAWQPFSDLFTVRVAVAGDVVWVTELGRVRRFVDTGTSLELTATLVPPRDLTDTWTRLATEDELVLLDDEFIHRFTYAEGPGLTAHPAFRLPAEPREAFGIDYIEGLLLRSGERLLWVTRMPGPDTGSTSSVCQLQLGAEGGFLPAQTPCQRLPGTPVGIEPDALWLATYERALNGRPPLGLLETLHRWEVRDGVLVEVGMLPLLDMADLASPRRLGTGPVVPLLSQLSQDAAGLPRWSPERGALGLDLMPLESTQSPHASTRFYWTQGNGLVKVYAR